MSQEEILRKFIKRVQAMKDTDHNGEDNFASDFMVRGGGAGGAGGAPAAPRAGGVTRSPFPIPRRPGAVGAGGHRIPGLTGYCVPRGSAGSLCPPPPLGRDSVRLDSASFLPPAPAGFVTAAPALPRSWGRGGHRLLQNQPGGSSSARPAASLST